MKYNDIRDYLPKHILTKITKLEKKYWRLADIIDYAYKYQQYDGVEKYESDAEIILEEIESILTEYDIGGEEKHFEFL
jgi:hypothetical protein